MKSIYFIAAIFPLSINVANAESWEKVILAVEKKADFYISEAERLGYTNTLTSEVNYLDYYREDHECGILGRMFNLNELVADYERLDSPQIANNLNNIEVVQLFAAGRTLESWVVQANYALKQTKVERVQRWNDVCADRADFKYAPTLLIANVPGFDAFPTLNTQKMTKPAVMPDFDGRDKSARMFRTRIRNGLAEGANFDGRYSFIAFGCGTSCIFSLITDTRNGQVFEPPFGGETTPELSIDLQLNSNLIHVIHMGDTSEQCTVRAWSFDGKNFNLEGEDSFARDGSCNYRQKIIPK